MATARRAWRAASAVFARNANGQSVQPVRLSTQGSMHAKLGRSPSLQATAAFETDRAAPERPGIRRIAAVGTASERMSEGGKRDGGPECPQLSRKSGTGRCTISSKAGSCGPRAVGYAESGFRVVGRSSRCRAGWAVAGHDAAIGKHLGHGSRARPTVWPSVVVTDDVASASGLDAGNAVIAWRHVCGPCRVMASWSRSRWFHAAVRGVAASVRRSR